MKKTSFLTLQKAQEIADHQTEECIIIGSDTVVAKGDEIMGKPKDKEDAFRMLDMISDDCHQVYTGVTIIRTGEQAEVITFAEKTDVYLYPISEADINAYIEKIEHKRFPINAERLVVNYFKTARKDPEGAYQILVNNPATYAPIETDKIPDKLCYKLCNFISLKC